MDRYFRWFGLPGALVLTCCLSLFAGILAIWQGSADRWICFGAMVLSSFGDIALMNDPPVAKRLRNPFLTGAGFFMAAHLCYLAAFFVLLDRTGCSLFNPGFFGAWAVGILTLWYFCRNMTQRTMFPLALGYLFLITSNCSVICAYAWGAFSSHPLSALAALGAASFFFSDVIIGRDILMGCRKYQFLIWWLYPIGQFLLIVTG